MVTTDRDTIDKSQTDLFQKLTQGLAKSATSIVILDQERRILAASPRFSLDLEYDDFELDRVLFDTLVPDNRIHDFIDLLDSINTIKQKNDVLSMNRIPLVSSTGIDTHFEVFFTIVDAKLSPLFLGLFTKTDLNYSIKNSRSENYLQDIAYFAGQQRENLYAILAQELSQPITAITLYVQTLILRIQNGKTDVQAEIELLEKTLRETGRVRDIINQVRLVSKEN